MTDKDVEREIEENQRRARPESEVGLDENVLRERENEEESRSIIDDLSDAIRGKDETEEQEVEYRDNDKATGSGPN